MEIPAQARLTTGLVRHRLIPVSYLIFFAGLVVSASIYYHGRPFDPRQAIVSDLEARADNPGGYLASAAGTVLAGVLLLPAAKVFYTESRTNNPRLTLAGTILLGLGLAATITLGALSPFIEAYSEAHIQLAYTAFTGVCAGTLFLLAASRVSHSFIAFQSVVLLFLGWIFIWPGFLSGTEVLRSLAFWEWVLCVDCGIAMWVLGRAVDSNHSGD